MTRRFTEPKLVAATHNQGKFEEIAKLLEGYPVELVSAAALGLAEPAETETSFVGNARINALATVAATGLPALADDSGIEIDALGGAPGVYTADWAAQPGGTRDFAHAMEKTWGQLEEVAAPYPRTARFRCVLVLAWPDGDEAVFDGTIEGQCVWPMRGTQGHGYDPMFQPDGFEITLGEMDRWQKNEISHRGDAFRKLVAACFA
jgi:XTP/dITP diphosphohydrolase